MYVLLPLCNIFDSNKQQCSQERICLHIFLHAVPITVGFDHMEYTTTEGEGVVSVCAAITHPETGVPRLFNLSYTRNGSAGT